MRDRCQPDVKLDDELQLNIIEMRKADRLMLAPPELTDLLTFFLIRNDLQPIRLGGRYENLVRGCRRSYKGL